MPAAESPHRTSPFPLPLGLVGALLAGVAMPVQGRVNGALSAELGGQLNGGVGAALLSFGSGLVVLVVAVLALPLGRRGLREMPGHVRSGAFPWWYMLAGAFGSFFVLAQGLTVTIIGVALFTVAVVTGQLVASVVADRVGFGPGGPRPITLNRLLGAVLALGGVVWAVWPSLSESGVSWASLGPLLMPLAAGFFSGFQQAMNGVQTSAYGNPLPATFFNFAVGTAVLGLVFLFAWLGMGPTSALPHQWWLYTGGALGIFFIASAAFLVRFFGVLVTSLGMIAGQLLGSLALDAVVPVPGSSIGVSTLLGTVVALIAVVIASSSLPRPRSR